ncbi:hypothetical protein [Otoolea muris]|uniref:hypothetical protein n=1 Tax=Otoolea muris TaxID=2941515 RepID=UPI00203B1A08|nr:hypothetical protein [Otoolea muris]
MAGTRRNTGGFDHESRRIYRQGILGSVLGKGEAGGRFVLWGISAVVLMLIKRSKYLLIILPAFANMAGLFLGCCFSDSRYFYPMFLLTVPYLAVLYLVFSNDEIVPGKMLRNRAAEIKGGD